MGIWKIMFVGAKAVTAPIRAMIGSMLSLLGIGLAIYGALIYFYIVKGSLDTVVTMGVLAIIIGLIARMLYSVLNIGAILCVVLGVLCILLKTNNLAPRNTFKKEINKVKEQIKLPDTKAKPKTKPRN